MQYLNKLAEQWINETTFISSATELIEHPAYQKIIEYGTAAIPFLLNRLKNGPEPHFWGPALEAITGENPVPKEHAGRILLIAQDWIDWGRDKGYLI